jgi:hypothetical protein
MPLRFTRRRRASHRDISEASARMTSELAERSAERAGSPVGLANSAFSDRSFSRPQAEP